MIKTEKPIDKFNKRGYLKKYSLFLFLVLVNYFISGNAFSQTVTTFTDVTGTASVGSKARGMGAAWGDYDNDRDMDLYLVNYGEPNVLYQNNGNNNRWIIIKPVGAISNKAGIGAMVKVTMGTSTQIREVDGGSGFCSQDSLWVHFGLNSNETLIRWRYGGLVARHRHF